jgi:ribosome modulation factor
MWDAWRWACNGRPVLVIGLFVLFAVGLTAGAAALERRDASRSSGPAEEGYRAGRAGQPSHACPHSEVWDARARTSWLRGWLRGDAERHK